MKHGTERRVGRAGKVGGTLKVSWNGKIGKSILLLSKFRRNVRLAECIDSYSIKIDTYTIWESNP